MIPDVYCAFFLPISRCSRSVITCGHHLQNCPEVSPVGRCTCPIIPVGRCTCPIIPVGRCTCPIIPVGRCTCPIIPVGRCTCPIIPVGRCTCPIIHVASKWQVLFSTKYNCFYKAFQDVNAFLVHLLVGLAQLIN